MILAYGRGERGVDRRAIEIARVPLTASLAGLRDGFSALCEQMALEVYPVSVLDGYDADAAHAALCAAQKRSGLSSIYAQEARMRVSEALPEQVSRRARVLFGKMKNLGKPPEHAGPGSPVFANLPDEVTREVGEAAVRRVAALWAPLEWDEAMAAIRDACALGDDAGAERRIARHLVTTVDERFGCPRWTGRGKDRNKARITLYGQTLRKRGGVSHREALKALSEQARSPDPSEVVLRLCLTSPAPRGEGMTIVARLAPKRLRRLAEAGPGVLGASALTLEIGERDAVIRVVITKPKAPTSGTVRVIVARDYGISNTVALSVIDLGRYVPAAEAAARIAAVSTKAEARAWLEENVAPDGYRVLERALVSAAGYRAHMADLGQRVDGLASSISNAYANLPALKAAAAEALGLPDGEAVPRRLPAEAGADASRAHGAFFTLLGRIRKMKEKRRGLYDRMSGVRASWLGLVSNRESALVRKHGAALVREELTYEAAEKGSPEYKGPAFNRMVNESSRGQYARRASAKMEWAGVLEFAVPSYYTSCTDHRHGVVDPAQRRGDVFVAAADGAREHADLHASETIGLWPFLSPREKPVRKASCLPHLAPSGA